MAMELPFVLVIVAYFTSMLSAYVLHLNVPEVVVHNRNLINSKNQIQPKEQKSDLLPPDLLEEKYIEAEKEEKTKAFTTTGQAKMRGKPIYRGRSSKLATQLKKKAKKSRNVVARKAKNKQKKKNNSKDLKDKNTKKNQDIVRPKKLWFHNHKDADFENTRVPLVDKDLNAENKNWLENSFTSFDSGINSFSKIADKAELRNNVQSENHLKKKEDENEVSKKSTNTISKVVKGSIVDEDDPGSGEGVSATTRTIGRQLSHSNKSTDLRGFGKKTSISDTGGNDIGEIATDVDGKGDFDGKGNEFNDKNAEKGDDLKAIEEDIDNIETYDSSTEQAIPVNNSPGKTVGNNVNGEGIDQKDIQGSQIGENESDKKEGETGNFNNFEENVDDNEYVDSSTEEVIDIAHKSNKPDNGNKLENSEEKPGEKFASEAWRLNADMTWMNDGKKGKDTVSKKDDNAQNENKSQQLGEFNAKPTPPVILNSKSDEFSNGTSGEEVVRGSGESFTSNAMNINSSSEGNNANDINGGNLMGNESNGLESKNQSSLGILGEIEEEKNRLLQQADNVLNDEFQKSAEMKSLVGKAELAENREVQANEFYIGDDGNSSDISENQNNTFSNQNGNSSDNNNQLKANGTEATTVSNEGNGTSNGKAESYQLKTDNMQEDTENSKEFSSTDKARAENNSKMGLNEPGKNKVKSSIQNGGASDKFGSEDKSDDFQGSSAAGSDLLPKSELGDQAADSEASEEIGNDDENSESSSLALAANNSDDEAEQNKEESNIDDNSKTINKGKSAYETTKDNLSKADDEFSVVKSKLDIAQHLYNDP